MTQPIKVNGPLGAFLNAILKIWPIVLVIGVWASTVEVRLSSVPKEVPPAWFKAEVDGLKKAVEDVDTTVHQNSERLIAIETQLKLQRPDFADRN